MSVDDAATQNHLAPLISLFELELGAAQAYGQAIAAIDIPEIRERLGQYRDDHELHIEALSVEIHRLGAEPPERSPDLQGQLVEGYTAVRAAMGIAGALRAMKSNEVLTNTRYEAALSLDASSEVKEMLARHREDEKRHLAYIEAVLEDRVWEIDPTPGMHGRLSADFGQLIPMGLGAALVLNGIFRPTAVGIIGAAIGAGLVATSLQSGVDPGGLVAGLTRIGRRKGTAATA